MEAVLSFLGTELVQQITTAFISLFVGGIGVWLWVKLGAKNALKVGGEYAGNQLGLFLYHNVLKNIKDDNLRKKMVEDLNTAGNDLDRGWDAGLEGIKIG
jgi:hypothetical protein